MRTLRKGGKYGWKHVEPGYYFHECGSTVFKRESKWGAGFVDGSVHAGHDTAQNAILFVEQFDPNFWAFDKPPGRAACPIGGVMIDIGDVGEQRAFTVRTCSRFLLAPFVERYFRKMVFGFATCAHCLSHMSQFRFETMPYFGDVTSRYPYNPGRDFRNYLHAAPVIDPVPDDNDWSFLACHCRSPLWFYPDVIRLSIGLRETKNREDRRLRMVNAPGHYTQQDIEEKLQKQEGRCFYCKTPFPDGQGYTVDHIVPLAAGGTHWPDNICLACKACNSSKGDMPLENFLVLLASKKTGPKFS